MNARWLLGWILLMAASVTALAQDPPAYYQDCAAPEGDNSNVVLPDGVVDIDGEAPENGDIIAIFTAMNRCAGAVTWNDTALPLNLRLSGNAGGLSDQEPLRFRIWDQSRNLDTRATPVYASCDNAPCETSGFFMADVIYLIESLASDGTPFPVELTAFGAFEQQDQVELWWETQTETNNAGFEIEHSVDGLEFVSIGFEEGRGTTVTPHRYTFTTSMRTFGVNYYRLKQVDFSGEFEYSPIVEVYIDLPGPYILEGAYPNPFQSTTTLSFTLREESDVRLTVHDALGRTVETLFDGRAPAFENQRLAFDAATLPSGLYFYRLEGNSIQATGRMLLVR